MVDAGTLLRYARRRAGISQRTLAERTGVARSQVERIEAGGGAQFDTVARLLAACGLGLTPAPIPATGRAPAVCLDPRVRPVHRLYPEHRRGDPRPSAARVLDQLAGTQAVIIGRVAAALLGAAVPWTQIDVCPAPTDLLPADSLLVLHEGHGGLDHEHLRRAARYLDSAELPMPHVAALFIADPVDLLIMATREDDPGLVAAVQAVLTAERHRPVRDEGARRYPAHSQAKEGDRLDPFAAVWQPVVRRRRGRQGA